MSVVQHIAVAVVGHEGSYLIGQRGPDVPLPGAWEFPGGKVHPDETPAEAAVRECREETGLDVQVIDEFPGTTHTYEHGTLELHFFRCRVMDAGGAPRWPFRWVSARALRDYEFPAANRELVATLARCAD